MPMLTASREYTHRKDGKRRSGLQMRRQLLVLFAPRTSIQSHVDAITVEDAVSCAAVSAQLIVLSFGDAAMKESATTVSTSGQTSDRGT